VSAPARPCRVAGCFSLRPCGRHDTGMVGARHPDFCEITVVGGRPGSGKSTYVYRELKPGDLVVDFDAIAMAVSGQPEHQRDERLVPFVHAAEKALLERLRYPHAVPRAWVLTARPSPEGRVRLAESLNGRLIDIDTPLEECIRRIESDPGRPPLDDAFRAYIESWKPA